MTTTNTMIKKVPKLRFREFSNEWQQKNLGELIDRLDSGVSVNSENRRKTEGEYGILKTSCVSEGAFYPAEYKVILSNELDRARLNPQEGAIIVSRMNTPQLVGESGYVGKTYPDLFVPDRLWMITINPTKVNAKWLSYILSSKKLKTMLTNIATGTSNSMKNISQPSFFSLRIHTPQLSEQEKIAGFLSGVDNQLFALQQKANLLQKYKHGVTQAIFSQRIRFKGDKGKSYRDWQFIKAKEVFDNVSNKDHNGDLPVLAVTQDNGIVTRDSLKLKINSSEEGIKNYKIIEPGNFVISLRSFQGGIELSNINGISSPAYTVLKASKKISNNFYKNHFKRESFISQLNSAVIGIRDGKQISYGVFSDLVIPFPEYDEQQKIADFLTSLDDKINLTEKELEQAKTFKKALLRQMLV
jgi:type I restriction enzyme S subunit